MVPSHIPSQLPTGRNLLWLTAPGVILLPSTLYSMTNFLPQWPELLADAVRVGVILLLTIIAIRLLRSFTNRLIHKAVDDSASRNVRMREQQTKTVAGVLYSAGVFVILLVALLTTLEVFHFNIVPIAGAAGLASLGIGI